MAKEIVCDTTKQRLLKSIPYYPKTITVTKLAKRTGLSTLRISQMLLAIPLSCMLCCDGQTWTRLRRDLSNVD